MQLALMFWAYIAHRVRLRTSISTAVNELHSSTRRCSPRSMAMLLNQPGIDLQTYESAWLRYTQSRFGLAVPSCTTDILNSACTTSRSVRSAATDATVRLAKLRRRDAVSDPASRGS